MSLSAEALAQVEGLDLQEAREGLNFASATEVGQSVGADLSNEELAGLRSWDLSGVTARLNGLTFKQEGLPAEPFVEPPPAPMPEMEEPVAPVPATEGDLPEWLRPAEPEVSLTGAEPPAEEPAQPAPLPEEQPAASSGPTSEEAAAGLAAAKAAGPTTQAIGANGEGRIPPAGESRRREALISVDGMKKALKNYLSTWLDRKKLSLAGEFTGGTAAGFLANLCFTELIAKNPQMATLIPLVLTKMQVFGGGFLTNVLESGALDVLLIRKKLELANKYTRAAKLAERISVMRSADNLVDLISLFTATTARETRDTLIRPGAAGFIAGAWLYAGLAGAGAFGQDHMLFNGTEAAAPIVSDGGAAIGGLPPDERGNVDHQSQWPTAGVGPGAAGGSAGSGGEYNPPFTGPNVPMPELPVPVEVLPPVEALQSGKTIGELAEVSGQLPWNVVRESVGGGPHAGEVTNVVTRALQAGGVDISNLHEGAISQLVTKVQGLFDNADTALQAFNTDHPYAPRPYDAGGLGAVETVKGLNSPEVQAIRAANLGDMEAARNIFDSVIKSELQPILP